MTQPIIPETVPNTDSVDQRLEQLLAQVTPQSVSADQCVAGISQLGEYRCRNGADISSTSKPSSEYLAGDFSRYNVNYLGDVRQDLDNHGLSYSVAELQQMRENLKLGYQNAKKKVSGAERWELLSAYRSAIGKLNYVASTAKAVEGKDLESLFHDKNKSIYERLGMAKTWSDRAYVKAKSAEQKQDLARKLTYAVLYDLPQTLADEGLTLNSSERKRYHSLTNAIVSLKQPASKPYASQASEDNVVSAEAVPTLYDKYVEQLAGEGDDSNVVSLSLSQQARLSRELAPRTFARGSVQKGLRTAGKKVARAAVAAAVALGFGMGMIGDSNRSEEPINTTQSACEESVEVCSVEDTLHLTKN